MTRYYRVMSVIIWVSRLAGPAENLFLKNSDSKSIPFQLPIQRNMLILYNFHH